MGDLGSKRETDNVADGAVNSQWLDCVHRLSGAAAGDGLRTDVDPARAASATIHHRTRVAQPASPQVPDRLQVRVRNRWLAWFELTNQATRLRITLHIQVLRWVIRNLRVNYFEPWFKSPYQTKAATPTKIHMTTTSAQQNPRTISAESVQPTIRSKNALPPIAYIKTNVDSGEMKAEYKPNSIVMANTGQVKAGIPNT